jgi:hypothetical protein
VAGSGECVDEPPGSSATQLMVNNGETSVSYKKSPLKGCMTWEHSVHMDYRRNNNLIIRIKWYYKL